MPRFRLRPIRKELSQQTKAVRPFETELRRKAKARRLIGATKKEAGAYRPLVGAARNHCLASFSLTMRDPVTQSAKQSSKQ